MPAPLVVAPLPRRKPEDLKDHSPLAVRMLMETSIAIAASLMVSPLVAVIDQAITSNASGREKLLPSLVTSFKSIFANPVRFFKSPPLLIMSGVYTGTYAVANCVDAIFERSDLDSSRAKLIASSGTNITLINLKDIAYARMFGQGAPRPFPKISMGLFALRDGFTITASFSSLPSILSEQIFKPLGFPSPDTLGMLAAPMSVQVLTTPLHLLGLDLYNRDRASSQDRMSFIRKEYLATAIFRMARALPAFGIGGVVNKQLRMQGKELIIETYQYQDNPSRITMPNYLNEAACQSSPEPARASGRGEKTLH